MSFPCECGQDAPVVFSRRNGRSVRRRYKCVCGQRWSTTEQLNLTQKQGRTLLDTMEIAPEELPRFERYFARRLRALAYGIEQAAK